VAGSFWLAVDDGAAALRKEVEARLAAGGGEARRVAGEGEEQRAAGHTAGQQSPPRIFVSVVVYRDPEAQHTLKDMFDKASHPQRVFAGVVWQYKVAEPKPSEDVNRLHGEVNMLTRMVEAEGGKITDPVEQDKYLR
jgi:hypothetical protein